MMFREKGKKIVCLRSEYSTETQRSYARQVASFDADKSTVSLPNNVHQLLTDEEYMQYVMWRSKHEEEKLTARHVSTLEDASESLVDLIEGLGNAKAVTAVYMNEDDKNDPKNGSILFDQTWADELYSSIAALRKALKKAGFKPSSKQPVSVDVPVDDGASVPVDDTTSVPVDDAISVPVDDATSVPVVDAISVPVDDATSVPVDDATSVPVVDDQWFNNQGGS